MRASYLLGFLHKVPVAFPGAEKSVILFIYTQVILKGYGPSGQRFMGPKRDRTTNLQIAC